MRAIPLSLAVLVAAAAPETVAAQSGASLQTCLAAAADYSPVYPTVVFPLTSPELDAVFRLGQGEHYKRLSAKWIAVDVGSVAPPNTLTGTEVQGVHLAWARGGVPFSEEWWQLTDRGLAASQRRMDGEMVALDPPQIVLAWPVAMGRRWDYVSRDHALRQSYRIWGPVPVKGPQGEAPGYVVLVQQKGPIATTTVEREYLPGLGM